NLEVGRQRGGWGPERGFALFPNLAEARDRPASRISGGEQQMLAIGRCLMGNPSCILLDEPSEGLAPIVVDQVAEAIRALKASGVAVLLAEQNWRFASAVADRGYVIEKGRIAASGALADLAARQAPWHATC